VRSSLQGDEEEKLPDVDFSNLGNPLEEFLGLLGPQEMMFLIGLPKTDALNHLPKKIHDHFTKKK